MEEKLISFVTDDDGSQLSLHLDLKGCNELIGELEKLKKSLEENDCPHIHLFTEEWGAGELTPTKIASQESEVTQVHHVKIYGWNNEWKVKHGLV